MATIQFHRDLHQTPDGGAATCSHAADRGPARPKIVAHRGLLQHAPENTLANFGLTIAEPQVRDRLKRASPQAQTAAVANNADEFSPALTATSADWVYFRYLPSESQIAAVRRAGKKSFIAGATVSGNVRDNWRQAAAVGIDGILTDHPLELRVLLRQAP